MKAYVIPYISTLNIFNMFTKIYKNITNVFCHYMSCVFNLYNDKAETKKKCIPSNSIQIKKVIFVLTTLIMYNRHKQLTLFCNSAKFQNATCLFHILSQ